MGDIRRRHNGDTRQTQRPLKGIARWHDGQVQAQRSSTHARRRHQSDQACIPRQVSQAHRGRVSDTRRSIEDKGGAKSGRWGTQ